MKSTIFITISNATCTIVMMFFLFGLLICTKVKLFGEISIGKRQFFYFSERRRV